ncbi:phosphotransferase [Hansschlegelia zhihuaiae]|uniref:Aminoglycoside phosphotransferase domain-containing protein n=1 Tax=Hansschlegelia zhihuaiae TaxID=405005 RepID=A0A4Q0MJY5_9HYPH|nr:phosphotransferase [Hansschlegelia zhihuaiae]RXF73439.1 hypothetical protein EK403_09560 [Hansschlegelia zhihuaiae]
MPGIHAFLRNATLRWRGAQPGPSLDRRPRLVADADRSEAALELGRIADRLRGEPEIKRGVESLVAASIGAPVKHLRSELVPSPRTDINGYVAASRVHTRHLLEVRRQIAGRWSRAMSGNRLWVFVKTGRGLTPAPPGLNDVASEDFCAPFCFGSFAAQDLAVEVSEHVGGERIPFRNLSPDLRTRLVRAVAGVNAVRSVDVPNRTRWIGVSPDWLEERCAENGRKSPEAWRSVRQRLARVDQARDDIKASIRGGRLRLFTHNDVSPGNVAFAPDDRVYVLDWEKATRSLPGADLRFLLELKNKDALLDAYLVRMSELGVALDRSRVARAIDVTEGFRRVRAGCANGNLKTVEAGLGLLETHLPR